MAIPRLPRFAAVCLLLGAGLAASCLLGPQPEPPGAASSFPPNGPSTGPGAGGSVTSSGGSDRDGAIGTGGAGGSGTGGAGGSGGPPIVTADAAADSSVPSDAAAPVEASIDGAPADAGSPEVDSAPPSPPDEGGNTVDALPAGDASGDVSAADVDLSASDAPAD